MSAKRQAVCTAIHGGRDSVAYSDGCHYEHLRSLTEVLDACLYQRGGPEAASVSRPWLASCDATDCMPDTVVCQ